MRWYIPRTKHQDGIRWASICPDHIQAGEYRSLVTPVREAVAAGASKPEVNRLKKKLPGIMVSGRFKQRTSGALEEYSGLLCLDLDGLADEVPATKERVARDPHVASAFVSPSGLGLKVVVPVGPNPEQHQAYFRASAEHFKATHGVVVDAQCKDLSRLCFVSDDEDIHINPAAQMLLPLGFDNSASKGIGPVHDWSKIPRARIERALKFIPADEYVEWRNVGFALHDWCPDEGIELFDEWSMRSANYGEVEEFWRGIKGGVDNPITLKHLFNTARAYGWKGDKEEIAEEYCHDGKHYWRKNERGLYIACDRTSLRMELQVKHGVSTGKQKGTSEADQITHLIETRHDVAGVGPFLFKPLGIVPHDGTRYLNNSTVEVLAPLPAPREWGGGFPFIKNWLEQMFPPPALEHLLDWTSHVYGSAHAGDLKKGTVLVLAGAVSRGKGLFANLVLGKLLGGWADASNHLLGDTRFNNELYQKAVFCVDDGRGSLMRGGPAAFSERLKQLAANREFSVEAKFGTPVKLPWAGRVVVTLNLDENGLRRMALR